MIGPARDDLLTYPIGQLVGLAVRGYSSNVGLYAELSSEYKMRCWENLDLEVDDLTKIDFRIRHKFPSEQLTSKTKIRGVQSITSSRCGDT